MTPDIINHIYGGPLPPGCSIRRHEQPRIPVYRHPSPVSIPVHKEPLQAPIQTYMKAYPWSTAPQVAAALRKACYGITGTLSRLVKDKEIERRGCIRHYEYRIRG